MNNSELFKKVFGIYAEEFWAYPEEKMLDWLTSDVPTEDVRENVHGHWEEKYDDNDDAWCRRKFYCSVCGDWNTYGKTKFCPYCGAVMDEDL